MNNDRDFLMGLPKAELHIHIEGSLEPELMFELAARNAIKLPYASVDEVRAAYQFTDLQSFLDIYYAGAAALITARDFEDLAWAYFERSAEEGLRHAELFFDPQTHTERSIPLEAVLEGLEAGMKRARDAFGISSSLILCFLRHLPEEAAMAALEEALPHRDRFIGVGLDSSELGHPPEKFARVFERARAEGIPRVVAHAGEEGPPEYIRQALDLLQIQRVDHGVRCLEDEALVARLAREKIPLTVCPLSNVKLCVFDTLEDHNLPALLDRGLTVTINSDDPAYFGGYIGENYCAVARELGLDREAMIGLARASFAASFLSEDEKKRRSAEIDAYLGLP